MDVEVKIDLVDDYALENALLEEEYTALDELALCRFYEDRESSFAEITKSFYDPHRLPNDIKHPRHGEMDEENATVDESSGCEENNAKRQKRRQQDERFASRW